MRRVDTSFKLRARWWEGQVDRTFDERPDYREGANAYAYRQAFLRRSMNHHWVLLWRSVRNWIHRSSSYDRQPDSEPQGRKRSGEVEKDRDMT